MKNKLLIRIILDILIFGAALIGQWWIIFPIGIVCVWYYKRFFEFPLAAFAFDVIYAAPRDKFYGFEYIYSSIALILFFIVIFLRSKIRKDLWPKNF